VSQGTTLRITKSAAEARRCYCYYLCSVIICVILCIDLVYCTTATGC